MAEGERGKNEIVEILDHLPPVTWRGLDEGGVLKGPYDKSEPWKEEIPPELQGLKFSGPQPLEGLKLPGVVAREDLAKVRPIRPGLVNRGSENSSEENQ